MHVVILRCALSVPKNRNRRKIATFSNRKIASFTAETTKNKKKQKSQKIAEESQWFFGTRKKSQRCQVFKIAAFSGREGCTVLLSSNVSGSRTLWLALLQHIASNTVSQKFCAIRGLLSGDFGPTFINQGKSKYLPPP